MAAPKLFLDLDVFPGGSVSAEILGQDGSVVDGFGFHEAIPIRRGGNRIELAWRGERSLQGREAQIRFEIRAAVLFGFEVGT